MRTVPVLNEELFEVEREMRYLLRLRKMHPVQQLRFAELRGMQQALKFAIGDDLTKQAPTNTPPARDGSKEGA